MFNMFAQDLVYRPGHPYHVFPCGLGRVKRRRARRAVLEILSFCQRPLASCTVFCEVGCTFGCCLCPSFLGCQRALFWFCCALVCAGNALGRLQRFGHNLWPCQLL
jgi:hypothetical protein